MRCVCPSPAHRTGPPDSSLWSFTHSGLTQLLHGPSVLGGHSRKCPSSYSLWWPIWKPSRKQGLERPELSVLAWQCRFPRSLTVQPCLASAGSPHTNTASALPFGIMQEINLERRTPFYHPTSCPLLQLTPSIPLPHTFSGILAQLFYHMLLDVLGRR